jgi:Ca2+:H+ antiporter
MTLYLRLGLAWATTAIFLLYGPEMMADAPTSLAIGLFAWLLGVIVWAAFGVVHEAEELAERLGEPFGTLILTLSIVIMEVALISAVMLGSKSVPTLGRDTMFAVLMIVLNGIVGLGLLIGGLKHHQQSFNLQGASAYLMIIIPLTVIALVLPNFTTSTSLGTLSLAQSVFFSIFTVSLYGLFLWLQTGRHRGFFMAVGAPSSAMPRSAASSLP